MVQEAARQAQPGDGKVQIIEDLTTEKLTGKVWTHMGGGDSWKHKFLACVQENFLYQYVTEQTTARGPDTPSILDLVFTYNSLENESVISDNPP